LLVKFLDLGIINSTVATTQALLEVVVAQVEEQSAANQKVNCLTLSFPGTHVDVSLGKTPNPTLPDASIGV